MLLEFLKQPRKTGALCSSSKALSKAIVYNSNLKEAMYIAEIGAGLGIFTQEIINGKNNDSKFIAIEINPIFCKKLHDRFSSINNVYIENRNANEILDILKTNQINSLDIIVSGIPWTILKPRDKILLLSNICSSLKEGGIFSTFIYAFPTPQARSFKKMLNKKFSQVKTSKIIWKNMPPAIVYYCKK